MKTLTIRNIVDDLYLPQRIVSKGASMGAGFVTYQLSSVEISFGGFTLRSNQENPRTWLSPDKQNLYPFIPSSHLNTEL